jgi:hypothetical protein
MKGPPGVGQGDEQMESQTEALQIYRNLARCYEERGDIPMRDRFLILAADTAFSGGQFEEAERLREQLLRVSRHHMLRGYRSFAEAREAADVQTYVRDLRQNYPVDTAHRLLQSLPKGTAMTPPSNSGPGDFSWDSLDGESSPSPRKEVPATPPVASSFPFIDDAIPPKAKPKPAPAADKAPQPARKPSAPPAEPVADSRARPAAQPKPKPAPARAPLAAPIPLAPEDPPRAKQPARRPAGAAAPGKAGSVSPKEINVVPVEAPHTTGGAWLGATLAILLSLVGLSWLVFTLGEPFFPH